jgi:hypothetical protein
MFKKSLGYRFHPTTCILGKMFLETPIYRQWTFASLGKSVHRNIVCKKVKLQCINDDKQKIGIVNTMTATTETPTV